MIVSGQIHVAQGTFNFLVVILFNEITQAFSKTNSSVTWYCLDTDKEEMNWGWYYYCFFLSNFATLNPIMHKILKLGIFWKNIQCCRQCMKPISTVVSSGTNLLCAAAAGPGPTHQVCGECRSDAGSWHRNPSAPIKLLSWGWEPKVSCSFHDSQ